MPDLVPVGTVTPEEKAKVVEVLTTSEAKAAIMDAIRPNSIDVTELETVGTLNGKSLPILDNSENKLKSYPFTSLQNVMGDMVAATTSANEAASAANSAKLDCDAAAAEASQAAEDAASDTAEAINTMSATVANAIEEIEDVVGNLDLSSVGGTEDLRDILVANNYGYSVIQDIGHSTSTNKATIVRPNTAFSAIYKVNEGSEIYGAVVTMGGNDITSSAVTLRTKSYCRVSIASVTGNVEIVVIATKPIIFADNAVKAICVQNWGGQYVDGEITEYEASRVTTLGEVFKNNTTITSFDELRYFTGLTVLYSAFEGCSNLTSVILPKCPLTTLGATFSGCEKLKNCVMPIDVSWSFGASGLDYTFNKCEVLEGTVDLSKIKPSGNYISMTRCFDTCKKITKVITPQGGIQIDRAWITCTDLVTLQTDLSNIGGSGSNRLRNPTGGASSSTACKKLANITYGFRGANLNLQLGYAPLTHESVLQVIDGLGTVSSATLTISAVSRATLTDDELAIAIGKGWSVATAG